jgi:hypothetical protein
VDVSEQTKHTPGPWKVELCVAGGGLVIRIGAQTHVQIFPLSDARLIAAAPELLDALKVAISEHVECECWVCKKARAAIAKAKGN